ncbi:hypothetical protein AB0H73_06415 [Streptomyces olivoreticuli]
MYEDYAPEERDTAVDETKTQSNVDEPTHSPQTLRKLLATGAGSVDQVHLALPDGTQCPVSLEALVQVYAAVVEDRRAYSLYLINDVGSLCVEATGFQDGVVDITIKGLRYAVLSSGDEPVLRMCISPGCVAERLGTQLITAYCEEHLSTILPGMLPNAGDDIHPGDKEQAAVESLKRRLAAWDTENAEKLQMAESLARYAQHVRTRLEACPRS